MTEAKKALYWPNMRRAQFEEALKRRPVVVVPVGSIEQHGPHCPVDVDVSIPLQIALRASEAVRDFPLVVAQEVPLGFTHYNEGFVGTITLGLHTFLSVIRDVGLGIHGNGFQRIIFLNGHGGNQHPMRAAVVDLARSNVFALAINHWELIDDLANWGERDQSIGHGGEWETSLQLYLRPALVDRASEVAETWAARSVAPEFAQFKFPERQRETPHGVMGDPTVASAAKGERYMRHATETLVRMARAYHDQDIRDYLHWRNSDSATSSSSANDG